MTIIFTIIALVIAVELAGLFIMGMLYLASRLKEHKNNRRLQNGHVSPTYL